MNILFEVLNELKYKAEIQFTFKLDDENEFKVSPFVSTCYPSQVFLVVNLDYGKLSLIRNSEFLPELATAFCKQTFHTGQMDKNTALIIKSFGSDEELKDTSEKIKIEDDPYYFKKYVFSCTEQMENKAIAYFKDRKNNDKDDFSYVTELQKYLLKLDMFEKYKSNTKNEEVYSYMAELTTKIPVLPLQVESAKHIKTVKNYFDEYLSGIGKSLNVKAIENLLSHEEVLSNLETENLLSVWNSCLEIEGK